MITLTDIYIKLDMKSEIASRQDAVDARSLTRL